MLAGMGEDVRLAGRVEQGRQLEGEDFGVGRAGLLPLTIPADQPTP